MWYDTFNIVSSSMTDTMGLGGGISLGDVSDMEVFFNKDSKPKRPKKSKEALINRFSLVKSKIDIPIQDEEIEIVSVNHNSSNDDFDLSIENFDFMDETRKVTKDDIEENNKNIMNILMANKNMQNNIEDSEIENEENILDDNDILDEDDDILDEDDDILDEDDDDILDDDDDILDDDDDILDDDDDILDEDDDNSIIEQKDNRNYTQNIIYNNQLKNANDINKNNTINNNTATTDNSVDKDYDPLDELLDDEDFEDEDFEDEDFEDEDFEDEDFEDEDFENDDFKVEQSKEAIQKQVAIKDKSNNTSINNNDTQIEEDNIPLDNDDIPLDDDDIPLDDDDFNDDDFNDNDFDDTTQSINNISHNNIKTVEVTQINNTIKEDRLKQLEEEVAKAEEEEFKQKEQALLARLHDAKRRTEEAKLKQLEEEVLRAEEEAKKASLSGQQKDVFTSNNKNVAHNNIATKPKNKHNNQNNKQLNLSESKGNSDVEQPRKPSEIDMYTAMKDNDLYLEVKKFLIKNEIQKKPGNTQELNEKFGKENIKRLLLKGYLISLGKGVTMGI